MTYRPRARCIICGTPRALAGGLSRTGKCYPCGEKVMADALRSVATHQGPVYDRYLNGLTDYVASLWGERITPPPPERESFQLSLLEVM